VVDDHTTCSVAIHGIATGLRLRVARCHPY
jgi:hypothetical protein